MVVNCVHSCCIIHHLLWAYDLFLPSLRVFKAAISHEGAIASQTYMIYREPYQRGFFPRDQKCNQLLNEGRIYTTIDEIRVKCVE